MNRNGAAAPGPVPALEAVAVDLALEEAAEGSLADGLEAPRNRVPVARPTRSKLIPAAAVNLDPHGVLRKKADIILALITVEAVSAEGKRNY